MNTIFISYRRSDSEDVTGRIYEHLTARFGRESVFKDVDSIPLGIDFRKAIREAVQSCHVVLAIIGSRWTDAKNDAGEQRLHVVDDVVRIELETALEGDIPVIPVLIMSARMPRSEELPPSLQPLSYRNAAKVRSDPDFGIDMSRLVRDIEEKLAKSLRFRSEPTKRIAEYIYTDRRRLEGYVEQLDLANYGAVALSWSPSEMTLRQVVRKSDHELISRLINHLSTSGQLDLARPLSDDDGYNGKLFALEEMDARKAILPVQASQKVPGLREIAVWVSDPAPEDLKGHPETGGTFLYLIESYWGADGEYHGTYSGFSALMWIINELVSSNILFESPGKQFGKRFNHSRLLPINILQEIGAFAQPKRRIRALYRKRYISDERFFKDSTGHHRSYDLVAYPVFIEAF